MAKTPYMPKADSGKTTWLSNFSQKLPEHAPTVGVTDPEVASVAADNAFWAYICDAQNQIKQSSMEWTAYKNGLRSGSTIGEVPTLPTLPAAPAAVAANIFGRIGTLATRIKSHTGYTEAIGQDLGIVGAEQVIDLNTVKPALKLTLQAGRPNVGWAKQTLDGVEI